MLLLSAATQAQSQGQPHSASRWSGSWGGGLGIGNGLEAHTGFFADNNLLALGRARYKWWGPSSGPGAKLFEGINTKSRQFELAALAGYGLPLGHARAYAAAGVSYVAGRKLGDYRYSIRSSGLVGGVTHYYAYDQYQAIGLPLEVGFMHSFPRPHLGVGVSFQADFSPTQSVFCMVLTLWAGRRGLAPPAP